MRLMLFNHSITGSFVSGKNDKTSALEQLFVHTISTTRFHRSSGTFQSYERKHFKSTRLRTRLKRRECGLLVQKQDSRVDGNLRERGRRRDIKQRKSLNCLGYYLLRCYLRILTKSLIEKQFYLLPLHLNDLYELFEILKNSSFVLNSPSPSLITYAVNSNSIVKGELYLGGVYMREEARISRHLLLKETLGISRRMLKSFDELVMLSREHRIR